MSFVGKSEKQTGIEIDRAGGGFYPSLSTGEFRNGYEVKTNISDEEIESKIKRSLMFVMEALLDWAVTQKNDGITKLEEVPYDALLQLGDDSPHTTNFKSAVYNHAHALILENKFNYDLTRKAGEDKGEKIRPQIAEAYRNSIEAIRMIRGETKVKASIV